MTRKLTGNTSVVRGIAPFIAVLTVIIALAALAQERGAGEESGKSPAASGSRNVGGPPLAQERHALLGGNSAERGAVVRSPRNRLGADPMAPGAPFFLPPVFYDPKGVVSGEWRSRM